MMKTDSGLIDCNWLNLIKGKKLINAEGLIYFENGLELPYEIKPDGNNFVEALTLEFQSAGSGRFFCGSDGSSIGVDHCPLEELSLGEYGKLKISNFNHQNLWIDLINKTLVSIKLIKSSLYQCTFGISFLFESNLKVIIANLGDDLVFIPNLHPNILREEQVEFITIQ